MIRAQMSRSKLMSMWIAGTTNAPHKFWSRKPVEGERLSIQTV